MHGRLALGDKDSPQTEPEPSSGLCLLPRAALAKDHRLGHFKQQKRILSTSRRPEVPIQLWAGPRSLGRLQGTLVLPLGSFW